MIDGESAGACWTVDHAVAAGEGPVVAPRGEEEEPAAPIVAPAVRSHLAGKSAGAHPVAGEPRLDAELQRTDRCEAPPICS